VGPFEAPVLDLGCGDGFLASQLGGARMFDAGLDPDPASLGRAHAAAAHRMQIAGDACALPFPEACFATVIANSVLEHIPDLDRAIQEIARTLRPGGRLLITAPSHRFAALLLGSALLGRIYGDWFNRHSRHFHTLGAAEWTQRLEWRGLRVTRSHYYLTAAAMRAFDVAHYLSLPRWACRKLTGKWVAVKIPPLARLLERWIVPLASAEPRSDGPYIFIEARRRP
jgi:SAM-dependent methyltransferase